MNNRYSHLSRLLVSIVAIAIVAIIGSGSAFAGPPLTTTQVFSTLNIPAGSSYRVFVACPQGSVVSGGGWNSSSPTVDIMLSEYSSSNLWLIIGHNTDAVAHSLTAYAICLSGIPSLNNQSAAKQVVAANNAGTSTSTCSSGTLTGPGFAKSVDGLFINATVPNANINQVVATNNSPAPAFATSFSNCVGSPNILLNTIVAASNSVGANSVANATAACPTNYVVTGGGFRVEPGMYILSSSKMGNGWDIRVLNSGATNPVTSYAVCLRT